MQFKTVITLASVSFLGYYLYHYFQSKKEIQVEKEVEKLEEDLKYIATTQCDLEMEIN